MAGETDRGPLTYLQNRPMSEVELVAYYRGAYDECRRLLMSPRMNRPQRKLIEQEAYAMKAELEDRGLVFES